MGKSTHFTGQPVYSQLIKLLDKPKIKEISLRTSKSESYVKRLDGYTHLIVILFGVLKYFDFLRELESGKSEQKTSQDFFADVYADVLSI